jgi:hypothetical protein
MMADFLRPLDSHHFSAAYQQAMGTSGYLGAAGSMSQYYGGNFGHMNPMTSQFSSGMGYHHHHPGSMAGSASAFSFGSPASHMSGMPTSLVAGAMA